MEVSRFRQYEKHAFVVGLALRLLLIFCVIPVTFTEWFLPFLIYWPSTGALSYWTQFLTEGGDLASFPYGPIYLLAYKPLAALGAALGGMKLAAIGLGLTVLCFDYGIFAVIRKLLRPAIRHLAVWFYWLSPVVLYVCYWHGQLDALPVFLLMLSILLLRRRAYFWCGISLGLAATAKFVMIIVVPFIVLYLLRDRRLWPKSLPFIVALLLAILIFLPFTMIEGFRNMVLLTPESQKIFNLKISVSETLAIYIVPAAYVLLSYLAWRIRRFDEAGLVTFIGAALFIVFLLTPAPAGWALWIAPFIAWHASKWSKESTLLVMGFLAAITMLHVFVSSGPVVLDTIDFTAPLVDAFNLDAKYPSLLTTLSVLAGILLIFQMFRLNIFETLFHKATRAPVLLSIAGDSGTGKDTLSEAMVAVLGDAETARISGDDYHVWDRKKPMWRAFTHLDPKANDLAKFTQDVLTLKKRGTIKARHYNHETGRMMKPRIYNARDFIISSGLHALFPPDLVAQSDMGVFLDMDEDLRRELKLRRDVDRRGHAKSTVESAIEARRPDADRFIKPQKNNADIVFRLSKSLGKNENRDYALDIILRPFIEADEICRYIVTLSNMDVSIEMDEDHNSHIRISGMSTAKTVEIVAARIAPNACVLLSNDAKWADGVTGLMQLFILLGLEQKLFKGNIS